jgi:hypothetical protein
MQLFRGQNRKFSLGDQSLSFPLSDYILVFLYQKIGSPPSTSDTTLRLAKAGVKELYGVSVSTLGAALADPIITYGCERQQRARSPTSW